MSNSRSLNIVQFAALSLLMCLGVVVSDVSYSKSKQAQALGDYRTIEWVDLIPEEDLDALLNPPEYLSEIEDGSEEDQISSQMQIAIGQATDSRYQQALVSTRVIPEFDGQSVRVPGFIVPLEFDDNLVVTEFFLVPYFGACLHFPPPPPNQIIHVQHTAGIKLEALEQPFWVSGILTTDGESNDMADAAYSMAADNVVVYEE